MARPGPCRSFACIWSQTLWKACFPSLDLGASPCTRLALSSTRESQVVKSPVRVSYCRGWASSSVPCAVCPEPLRVGARQERLQVAFRYDITGSLGRSLRTIFLFPLPLWPVHMHTRTNQIPKTRKPTGGECSPVFFNETCWWVLQGIESCREPFLQLVFLRLVFVFDTLS